MTIPEPRASTLARAATHPLTQRTFLEFWIGSTISLFGDQFYFVALPWLVLQISGSGLALGTVMMVAAIPRAIFMLMGGALTDRFSPRVILIQTAIARAALVSAVAALLWWHGIHLRHIYILSFCFGLADAFSLPATHGILPSLVAGERLRAANSAVMTSAQFSALVAPACAGYVVRVWGLAYAFLADALSFVFLIVPLARLRERDAAMATRQVGTARSILDGLKYVGANRPLRALMILAAGINLGFSGPIIVGLATLAKQRFATATAYGALLSALALGGLLGALLPGIVRHPGRRGLSLLAASFGLGLGMVVIAFLHQLPSIAIVLAAMGFVGGYVEVNLAAWFQAHVERALLGRVMSVMMFSAVGLVPLSLVIAGALSQMGVKAMFLISGSVILAVAALASTNAEVRSID